MATSGTDGQWWLNWDTVYTIWRQKGLKVIVSFQFTADVQLPTAAQWGTNVTNTSYNLGYK
jgi:hypothetical protein